MLSKKHDGRYDYQHVIPTIGVSKKQVIICPLHGSFHMSINVHKKCGCPKCGKATSPGWYNKKRLSDENLRKQIGTLYVVKICSDEEKFLKIGITKRDLTKRFNEIIKQKYQIELLFAYKNTLPEIKRTEDQLKKTFKKYRYVPLKSFGGATECYNLSLLENWTPVVFSSIPGHDEKDQ